jgi:hypothetical protein
MQEKQINMGFSLHAKCTIKILEIIDDDNYIFSPIRYIRTQFIFMCLILV